MAFYVDLDKRKSAIRDYIKAHPKATFREIKLKLHTKINKVYSGGMNEAYFEAGIDPPRTFKRMTSEEKREILIAYIKKNPLAGGQTIRRDTKINFFTLFKNTKELYIAAGVNYPMGRDRTSLLRDREEKRKAIIAFVRNNPLSGVEEIGRLTRTHPYELFKNIKAIYNEAGIPYLGKGIKRKLSKQEEIIRFIRNNRFATQREVNRACKAKVQEVFSKGIFEAYEKAGVNFPFERLNLHGAALKTIKDSAILFEEQIARGLSCYGSVKRLVKTQRGIADIIFERKNKKVVLEIKDYKSHEISVSQVNRLNKYVDDIGCEIGFLVCLKKPKKDSFLMGKNRLFILDSSELSKVPEIMDKDL